MNRASAPSASRLPLRRIDSLANARHRLAQPYRIVRRLPSGDDAQWLLRRDEGPAVPLNEGLALSTRFGPVLAFDYGPLLLACGGIDIGDRVRSDAGLAQARYAFAALPSTLQRALGEPTVADARAGTALHEGPTVAVNLLLRLPSIRLTMRLLLTVDGLHALLDSGEWERAPLPLSIPAWLARIDAAIPFFAGHTTLPLHECDALMRGDVVRLAESSFDVAGCTVVCVGACRLHLRWFDGQRCFEVQGMSHDADHSRDEVELHAADADEDAAACSDHQEDENESSPRGASATIDLAAIPIRLSFSLGTLALTVGELAALGPGSLLKLAHSLPPHVTIAANGVPVGTGELVDLDGQLAVEITDWARGNARSLEP